MRERRRNSGMTSTRLGGDAVQLDGSVRDSNERVTQRACVLVAVSLGVDLLVAVAVDEPVPVPV